MDALSSFLAVMRAESAQVTRVSAPTRWRSALEVEQPTLITVLRGELWITGDDGAAHHVSERGVALIPRPHTLSLADSSNTGPGESEVCVEDSGTAWTGVDECDSALMVSRFSMNRYRSERVLGELPPIAVVPDEGQPCPILDVIAAEWGAASPGRHLVLERSSEVLLLITLREWFAAEENRSPRWYAAITDPVVGPALRAIHTEPERRWTLEKLAALAPVSRATLANRFTTLTGEAPIGYLTNWRMTMAADLLTDTTLTLAQIADQTGYSTPFAFSHAFARHHRTRPTDFRRTTTTAPHPTPPKDTEP